MTVSAKIRHTGVEFAGRTHDEWFVQIGRYRHAITL